MLPRTIFCVIVLLLPLTARGDDRVSIPATINGHALRFGFDTGAGTGFVLWRNEVEKLGVKLELPPADFRPPPGEVAMALTDPVTLDILGRSIPNVRFRVFEHPAYLPMDVHGLVGWGVVKDNVIVLRLAEKQVSIMGAVPAAMADWPKLPVRSDRSQLVLTLPGKGDAAPGAVMIDTGTEDGVHLSVERWKAWREAHPRTLATMIAYYTPGAGLVVREACWADEISLDGLLIRHVPVMEANAAEATLVGAGYAATLGLAALRQLDLVIDAPHGIAYAQARTGPALPVQHNRLGAIFAPRGDQSDDLIARVAANSPAAAARIRDGDILLKIGQLDVTAWRTHPDILPLSRFWEQPAGTAIELTLRRGAETLKPKVTLRDILGPAAKR